MENDNKLIYIDEDGNEVLCEILFTFDSDEFQKSYVLFYEVGKENEEEVEVLAASYVPLEDGSVGELNDVETEEEWAMIEETLELYSDEEDDEDDEDDDDEDDEDDDEDDDDEEHEHHHGHNHECCGHNHNHEDGEECCGHNHEHKNHK